jgi:hypothetical protein
MKHLSNWHSLPIRTLLLMLLPLTISCNTIFFDTPQPADSENLKSVPKEIQGRWRNRTKTFEESIVIDGTSFHKTTIKNAHIAKKKIETSENIKISEGKIYFASDNFKTGYPYKLINDTVTFTELNEEQAFVLSDSVLIRSAKNCYVVNLKNRNWWEIVFIQKMKSGEIKISYPVGEDLLELKSKYNIAVLDSNKKDSIFFHADFKSRNIKGIINKKDEGTLYFLKPDSTFETSK